MKDKFTLTTLRMPVTLHSELKLYCVEEKVTMKEVMIEAITFHLERVKESEVFDLIPNLHNGESKKAIL